MYSNVKAASMNELKSPRTGQYYQAEDLVKRELVPEDWKPPRTDSKGKL